MNLCFSPVGDKFRIRSRMFPGLIGSTTIDYFHPWPRDALIGVANKFLAEIELPSQELQQTLSEHMAFVHQIIDEYNKKYKAMERRNNYTTPTSFLEFIKFYKSLLGDKRGKIIDQIERLKIGLQTMDDVANVVADLQVELDETMKVVAEEIEATGKIITVVDEQSADAAREQEIAQVQEDETNILANAAKEKMAACDIELASAIPLIKEAEAAVDCLTLNAINEFKSFSTLATGVDTVVKAALILNKKEKKNHSWDAGKKMMKDP
jgi:dynein heavy chain